MKVMNRFMKKAYMISTTEFYFKHYETNMASAKEEFATKVLD